MLSFIILVHSPITSFAACPSGSNKNIQVSDGLLSTDKDQATANNKFSILEKVFCVVGGDARIPADDFKYDQIFKIFFSDNNSPQITKQRIIGNAANITAPSSDGNYLYQVTGNLTITNNINLDDYKIRLVVFIDGNLIIDHKLTHTSQDSGLVFVTRGDIKINQNVPEVDAYIITSGEFCDAWSGSACTTVDNQTVLSASDTPNKIFTIKGSVISTNYSSTNPSLYKPKFIRTNTHPGANGEAERIIYEPKYLVILKDIFAREVVTWQEIY